MGLNLQRVADFLAAETVAEGLGRNPRGLNEKVVCPHCREAGGVVAREKKSKKGISGGKATGAVLTGGLSVLATGLSRKQKVTRFECRNCGVKWAADRA